MQQLLATAVQQCKHSSKRVACRTLKRIVDHALAVPLQLAAKGIEQPREKINRITLHACSKSALLPHDL